MKLELPKSWQDVTVAQFIELKSVEENDFNTHLSFKLDQLFILANTDIDDEVWDSIPADDLTDLIKKIGFINTHPSHNFKKQIDKYNYKESITLGEFIDLDYLCGINYIDKLPNICAILYRQNITNEWGHAVIEPRGYSELERSEIFLDRSINDVYGVLQSYLNLKKLILDNYGEMLNEEEKEDQEEEIHHEDKEAAKVEKVAAKWAWERVIYNYSQKSNMTFKDVLNLPLIFFMNQISMFHDLKI